MNYLAHIYLSGENEFVQIGNFIADQLKGIDKETFHPEIQKGIALHKYIDAFTDSHPVVHQTKKRLHPSVGKYAPVVSDIYFDHFLALHWQQYHDESLLTYSKKFYELLYAHKSILPERTRYILNYIEPNNWLYNYQFVEGLQNIFKGMARRARFQNTMDQATKFLLQDYEAYRTEFDLFFPQLIAGCKHYQNSENFL